MEEVLEAWMVSRIPKLSCLNNNYPRCGPSCVEPTRITEQVQAKRLANASKWYFWINTSEVILLAHVLLLMRMAWGDLTSTLRFDNNNLPGPNTRYCSIEASLAQSYTLATNRQALHRQTNAQSRDTVCFFKSKVRVVKLNGLSWLPMPNFDLIGKINRSAPPCWSQGLLTTVQVSGVEIPRRWSSVEACW